MATLRREFVVEAPAAQVWDVFRDVGAVHTRLAPGFVTDCRREGEDRIVTFANGLVAKELIADLDDAAMRLVYSARSERLAHHNASFQIFAEGPARCRVAWIADVLPHAAAAAIGGMMDAGVNAMKRSLDAKSE